MLWSYFFFHFFLRIRRHGVRHVSLLDLKWLESSKRSPKRKQESARQWKKSALLSTRNSVQLQLSPKKKNSRQKERMHISPKRKVKKTTYVYDTKKLRETDASSYVFRGLSLSLPLFRRKAEHVSLLWNEALTVLPRALARPATEPEAEEVLQLWSRA